MVRLTFSALFFTAGMLGVDYAYSQDYPDRDKDVVPEVNSMGLMPASITVFNSGIALIFRNDKMFDYKRYKLFDSSHTTTLDDFSWQDDTGEQVDSTSSNLPYRAPGIMGRIMENQSNIEVQVNNVVMNQRAAGNTQLNRMNVRMRSVSHFNFVGAGKWGYEAIRENSLPETEKYNKKIKFTKPKNRAED